MFPVYIVCASHPGTVLTSRQGNVERNWRSASVVSHAIVTTLNN